MLVVPDGMVDREMTGVNETVRKGKDAESGAEVRARNPLISLPTRLTDDRDDGRPGTATLIDNIWTSNVESRMESGLVTVRISDHLPVFVFVGGVGEVDGGWYLL